MARHRVTVIGALPLLVVAVAGCGGAAPGPSGGSTAAAGGHPAAAGTPAAPRPLTGAQTARAMLSTIDLPVGWSVAKEDLSPAVEEDDHGVQDLKGDAACDRVVADSFRAVRPSAVVSRTMENGMARSHLMFEVRTYPDERGAGQQLEQVRQLRRACATATAGPYTVSYGVLSAPRRGDESVGVRMRVGGNRFDEIVIRVGTSVTVVTFPGVTGDDGGLVESVTAQATEKLRQAAG
ncbi:hypothetical protein [Streptomyces chrestomyceticus]|uniref:hypothetical protein n=1 Tax=Streptomyces chrestomyceticus TaxID=68185 RepID=UPI0019D281C8|nr:hypothetical protein [Streptomyces chrestomyceticus]